MFDVSRSRLLGTVSPCRTREHVTKGWDNGEAFVDMLEGRNEGKAVISLE